MAGKKFITKKRGIIIALMLIIIAGVFSVVSVITGIISSEKTEEKLFVQNKVEQVLDGSKLLAQDYIVKRKLERDKIRESLNKQAATLIGDIQVFLQAAIIKKEADLAQDSLNEMRKKRERLAAFALQRFSSMTKEMLRLKQDVTRMQINLDNFINDAQNKLDPATTLLGSSSGQVSRELPEILAKIKSKNIENSKAFRERGSASAKNEVVKLRELRTFLDDKNISTAIDPEQLVNELTPDIANLLPENSILTISRAGGKVLVSLGSIEDSSDEISVEVARTMIFQIMGNSYQLMLSLRLNDSNVIAKQNIAEFSALLQNYIVRTLDTKKYSGYIFDGGHELLMSFPENFGLKTSIPENGWDELLAANITTFYKELNVKLDGLNFGLGICYEMKHISIEERINKIIEENPANAVLLVILAIVILLAVIVICVFGWRENGGGHSSGVYGSATSSIDIRSIKPELGSLKRLQKMNRGHNVGGSKILDYTRNEALKELVARVRGSSLEGLSSYDAEGGKLTHKSELREYIK